MLILGEARELEGIGQERQYDVATIDLHGPERFGSAFQPSFSCRNCVAMQVCPMSEMPYWLSG